MRKLFSIICVLFVVVTFGCSSVASDVTTEATEFTEISAPAEIPDNMALVATSYICIIDDNPVITPVFENTDDSAYYFYYRNSFTKITDGNGNPLDFDTIDTYYSGGE